MESEIVLAERERSRRRAEWRRYLAQEEETQDSRAEKQDAEIAYPRLAVAKESVLGFFLTEDLMETFRRHVARHHRSTKLSTSWNIIFEPTYDPAVNRVAQKDLKALIDRSRDDYKPTFVYRNDVDVEFTLPRRVDFRLDLVERFTIPDSDPRVQLRGQEGLRAKAYVPVHTVLGFYRGLVLTNYAADANLLKYPRGGWTGTPKQWKRRVRRCFTETDLRTAVPGSSEIETIRLNVSAFGYDSPASLINDPRIIPAKSELLDVHATGKRIRFSRDIEEDFVGMANVGLESASICGFPFPVAITTKTMIDGEELLYYYGRDHFLDGRVLKS